MNDLFFWKDWDRTHKIFISILFAFFCLAGIYLVYGFFYGLSNIISWETKQQLVPVLYNHLSYESGPLKMWLPLNQFLIFQYFEGSILKINPVFWTIYLIFLVTCINLILAVVSTISKFWFYGAMGAFIGFVVLFQPDHIQLFGNSDRSASILIFSLFLSIGYIFREFKPNLSILYRFIVFSMASILMGVVIYFYSGVSHPFSYLVSYGIGAPILVSVIFILTISHEIIYSFLVIASGTARSGSSKSLVHFTIMTLVYLFYVFITFLHNTQRIHWDLIYLNPVILLLIGAFAGFWWLRKRENLFKEILPFRPNAAMLYLSFGAMTFATYGFIFSVGNDPVAETFEDTIIYGQLGFGIMFFIYLIANFGAMMAKGLNIIPVSYKSRAIPFSVFRMGGLLAAVFMLYQAGFFPYFQAKAGYYNLIGDLFWQNKNTTLAKEYYQKGSDFEFQNHRSNYALASIAKLEKNKAEEIYFLENSNLKKPSPYSYVNVSNRFLENDQYFESLFKLNEGLSLFPGSPNINNNLGYLYSKTELYDSAYYYFNRARKISPGSDEIRSNSYALIVKANVNMQLDSITRELGTPKSIAGYTNLNALANSLGKTPELNKSMRIPGVIKTPEQFALIYNLSLNKLKSADTAFFASISNKIDDLSNPIYTENLKIIYALNHFENHQVYSALTILEQQKLNGYSGVNIKSTLGTLFLVCGDARSSLEEFGDYNKLTSSMDKFYYAVALMDTGQRDSASSIFNSLMISNSAGMIHMAELYFNILNNKKIPDSLNDEIKYNEFHYRLLNYDDLSLNTFIGSIQSSYIRDLVRMEQAMNLLQHEQYNDVPVLLSEIENKISDHRQLTLLNDKIQILMAIHNFAINGIPESASYIELPTNSANYLYNDLRNLAIAVSKKDSLNTSRFIGILSWDPFFEKGILTAVDYYIYHIGNPFEAYQTLNNALDLNRYSISLNKKIVLLSMDMNMQEYSKENLEILKKLLRPGDFGEFEKEMKAKLLANREKIRDWGYK